MSLAIDKRGHATAGILIWGTAVVLLGLPLIVGAGCAAGAGLLKEAYDYFHPDQHTVDPLDWFWTGWPAAIASVAAAFFNWSPPWTLLRFLPF